MGAVTINSIGKIIIDNSVIATIAGIEATGCFGIIGMASAKKGLGGLVDILKRDSLTRGVEVSANGDDILVNLHVVIRYGVPIKAVSQAITDAVTYKLKEVAGLDRVRVNITVEDIRL